MASENNHEYELVYIIQPEVSESGLNALNERITTLITNENGEMIGTELWGRRTLAYPIKKFFEGHYILHRFSMAPQGTAELDRTLRLNEDVIRYMLIRTDE